MAAKTLGEMFFRVVDTFPRPDCMRIRKGNEFVPLSTQEVATAVREVAFGLSALGVKKGDRVALLSYNRPEWAIFDYAAQTLGAPTVPIYTTLTKETVEYILSDSGAKVILVEDAAQRDKVLSVRANLPNLLCVVGVREAGNGVISFDELRAKGRGGDRKKQAEWVAAVDPEDVATIIYTSGTTGVPKGVVLTHHNFMSNIHATAQLFELSPVDSALSFLPLSHVFERTLDYALFCHGVSIAYASSIDAVVEELPMVRPTLMGSVPRLFEKFHARVRQMVLTLPPKRRALFEKALETGMEYTRLQQEKKQIPLSLAWRRFWTRLIVFKKIRARVGGRIRSFISGGAALPKEVGQFFHAVGLPILEGYGLSETSPVVTLNTPQAWKIGSVGRTIPGVEVKIAADGEILVRGPNVMRGYFNKPEETAQAIDPEGWFHTGDIGEFDSDKFLKITDRKKDLFKTSGGKYICPQPIENQLKQCSSIANAVVIGAGHNYASALLVPNLEAIAASLGTSGGSFDANRPEVRDLIQKDVDRVNQGLAKFETIKKFALLERDFTIEAGELTPTMKVKRRVIEEKYRSLIEGLYVSEEISSSASV